MFILVDITTREVLVILEERPKQQELPSDVLSIYVTQTEAAQLVIPSETWEPDPNTLNLYHKVSTQGTILTQVQLDSAITRQDAMKVRIQTILTFAQSMNGTAFVDLTTTQLKGLLQLLFAMNGMIDVNGNVDLTDFTIDSLVKSVI